MRERRVGARRIGPEPGPDLGWSGDRPGISLVLVNRYYINYRTTSESINLALAINAGLTVLAVGEPGGRGGLRGVGCSAPE